MSQYYETMYILRPDLNDDQVQQNINKYKEFLTENGAHDIEVKLLGKRRLAYLIQKYLDGIYVQMNYQGNGAHVAPMERAMRLSEDVIRYLTLKQKPPAPVVEAAASEDSEAVEAIAS